MTIPRSLAIAATLVSLAACATVPDRQATADVRIITPTPATCELMHEGRVTYRLPTTPAVIPAGSLTEQSVIGCAWTNAAGRRVTGTSIIGREGFKRIGDGQIVFPDA